MHRQGQPGIVAPEDAQQLEAERRAGRIDSVRPQADGLLVAGGDQAQVVQIGQQPGQGGGVHGTLMGHGGRCNMLTGIAGHLIAKAVLFFLCENHCATCIG